MNEAAEILANPVIQYGFAGFCIILMAIIVWLIRELLSVIKENNVVISKHNEILVQFSKTLTDTVELQVELKDKLNSRPCIAKFN